MLRTARCYSTTTNYVVFSPKVVYNMSQEFFTDDLRPITSFFNKVTSSMKQVLLWAPLAASSKAGGRGEGNMASLMRHNHVQHFSFC